MRVTAINTNQNTAKKQNFGVEVESFKPLTDALPDILGVKKAEKIVNLLFSTKNIGRIMAMRMPSGENAKVTIIKKPSEAKGLFVFCNTRFPFTFVAEPTNSKGSGEAIMALRSFDIDEYRTGKTQVNDSPRKIVNKFFRALNESLQNVEKSWGYRKEQEELAKQKLGKRVDELEKRLKSVPKQSILEKDLPTGSDIPMPPVKEPRD